MNPQDQIRFAIPIDILKGKNSKGQDAFIFKGLASTPDIDSQGETLYADRYDLSNFTDVNWNHKAKDDANAYLGQITRHNFQKGGLHVEGELYEEMPMTNAVVSLMKALNKRGKKLQLSVEGQVIKRGSSDPKNPAYKNILKAKLTGVAITNNPINSNTFCELIEKGYTNNEWIYTQEDQKLIDDIEKLVAKSMDTEAADPVNGESVEGAHKKNLKDASEARKINDKKGDEDNDETDENKKCLSKSFVYESIFNYFYPVTYDQANQVYNLINKIAMAEKKPITQETINKALDLLNIAQESGNQSDPTKTVEAAGKLIKSFSKDLKEADVIGLLVEQGYSEDIAKSAYSSSLEPEVQVPGNESLRKSLDNLQTITTQFSDNVDLKIGAVGLILKAQNELISTLVEQNESLTKSLDEKLTIIGDQVKKISAEPIRKGSILSSATERFIEKSADGVTIYNINDKQQRKLVADTLEALSGFNDGKGDPRTGKYDEAMMKAAADIESFGATNDAKVLHTLETVHKIKIVKA